MFGYLRPRSFPFRKGGEGILKAVYSRYAHTYAGMCIVPAVLQEKNDATLRYGIIRGNRKEERMEGGKKGGREGGKDGWRDGGKGELGE